MNRKYGQPTTQSIIQSIKGGMSIPSAASVYEAVPRTVARIASTIIWATPTDYTSTTDSQGHPYHRHALPGPEYPGGWKPEKLPVKLMTDARVKKLITSTVVLKSGNAWGRWDWKRIGKYSPFELAAMKSQPWDNIEWAGVLACPDNADDALLIVVQDRDRKDRLKAVHATKRDTANEITLFDFQSNAANHFMGSIRKWKRFEDICDNRRKENDREPDRIFKCQKSI